MGTVDRTKLCLTLDKEADVILEKLRVATGAKSRAEVLRNALGVFYALHGMVAGTKYLALVDREAGTSQRLDIPALTTSPP